MKRNLFAFKQLKLENDKGELERKIEVEGSEEVRNQQEKLATLEQQMQEINKEKE